MYWEKNKHPVCRNNKYYFLLSFCSVSIFLVPLLVQQGSGSATRRLSKNSFFHPGLFSLRENLRSSCFMILVWLGPDFFFRIRSLFRMVQNRNDSGPICFNIFWRKNRLAQITGTTVRTYRLIYLCIYGTLYNVVVAFPVADLDPDPQHFLNLSWRKENVL